jgi:hypothetical protein
MRSNLVTVVMILCVALLAGCQPLVRNPGNSEVIHCDMHCW